MTVLIIDDEPLVRRSLRRAFEIKKYRVLEAEDGIVGMSLWNQEKPELVFLDVLMPGKSGPEVLQELQPELRRQTKVVLMSAYLGEHGTEGSIKAGADLYLPKPFDDIFAVVTDAETLLGK